MNTDNSILIIGAGTFGLSTAYSLAKAGYNKVTVLEKSGTIPPKLSAGNDLNKIIRAEYEDPFYTDLALKAIEAWKKTPLFAPYFHQTGYLLATSSDAPEKSKRSLAKSLASISQHPVFRDEITPIESRSEISAVAPVFDGPMNWKGYFNRLAGYAHSGDALTAAYSACCALDVEFHLGDGVTSLDFSDDRCVGVTTASGRRHAADVVLLTLGASLASVLPQIDRQVVAKAWSVGHIQLTPDEAARLRGIPVTYARDLGFFFEPDPRTGLLKICPSVAGYTNYGSEGLSLPLEDNDWIPAEDEAKIRRLLRQTLPALADRPLIKKKLCWCADTADSDLIIDFVPGRKNLMVAGGDSGHSFKFLPVVGNWVKDTLEKGQQGIPRWRWKEGQKADGDVSWRVGQTEDLEKFKSRL